MGRRWWPNVGVLEGQIRVGSNLDNAGSSRFCVKGVFRFGRETAFCAVLHCRA
jgi:hypothetical protein